MEGNKTDGQAKPGQASCYGVSDPGRVEEGEERLNGNNGIVLTTAMSSKSSVSNRLSLVLAWPVEAVAVSPDLA